MNKTRAPLERVWTDAELAEEAKRRQRLREQGLPLMPRQPTPACGTRHGKRQRVRLHPDGGRVQVCEWCGSVISTISRPARPNRAQSPMKIKELRKCQTIRS